MLPVASCYRNRDKLRPDGPLGPNADFTYLPTYIWNSTLANMILEQGIWNRDSRTGLATMRFGMRKTVILIRKCGTRTMSPVMNGVSILIGPTCM